MAFKFDHHSYCGGTFSSTEGTPIQSMALFPGCTQLVTGDSKGVLRCWQLSNVFAEKQINEVDIKALFECQWGNTNLVGEKNHIHIKQTFRMLREMRILGKIRFAIFGFVGYVTNLE